MFDDIGYLEDMIFEGLTGGIISEIFSGISTGITVAIVFGWIITWIIEGLILTRLARKAHFNESEWMAYIPVIRDVYFLKMSNAPLYWMVVFGDVAAIIAYILSELIANNISIFSRGPINAIIFIYSLSVIIISAYLWMKLHKKFGINGVVSFIFSPAKFIINIIIITTPAIRWEGETPNPDQGKRPGESPDSIIRPSSGMIMGVSGELQGNEYRLEHGREVLIGRDADVCNIIFSRDNTNVSRHHCNIRYDGVSNCYYVTDLSRNGTFFSDGRRLSYHESVKVRAGQTIGIGGSTERIRLGNA